MTVIKNSSTLLIRYTCLLSLSAHSVFERDGSKVIIDKISLDLVKGATIDYTTDLMKSAFVVSNNPQSESACGCGSSFAAKNFSQNPALD